MLMHVLKQNRKLAMHGGKAHTAAVAAGGQCISAEGKRREGEMIEIPDYPCQKLSRVT